MGAGTVQLQTSKRNRRTKRVRPMSEINVTPFVDVMLVLLIIFMVTAPMLTVGIPIELPKTAANALPSENDVPLSANLGVLGLNGMLVFQMLAWLLKLDLQIL